MISFERETETVFVGIRLGSGKEELKKLATLMVYYYCLTRLPEPIHASEVLEYLESDKIPL